MSTIAEIMGRDPLEHTDKDLDELIDYLRQQRHQFHTVGVTVGRKAKVSKEAESLSNELSLKDLGL